MIIFVDGSQINLEVDVPNAYNMQYAWGIHATHNDITYEITGKMIVGDFRSYHEMVAFTEAVLFAYNRGVAPKDVVFYTDDEIIGHGHHFIRNNGYSVTGANLHRSLYRYLKNMKKFYSNKVLKIVRRYLLESRIHKVKGHSTCVMNNRVDYLATCIQRNIQIDSFERWYHAGTENKKGKAGEKFAFPNLMSITQ